MMFVFPVLMLVAALPAQAEQGDEIIARNTRVRDEFVRTNLTRVYFPITDEKKLKSELRSALQNGLVAAPQLQISRAQQLELLSSLQNMFKSYAAEDADAFLKFRYPTVASDPGSLSPFRIGQIKGDIRDVLSHNLFLGRYAWTFRYGFTSNLLASQDVKLILKAGYHFSGLDPWGELTNQLPTNFLNLPANVSGRLIHGWPVWDGVATHSIKLDFRRVKGLEPGSQMGDYPSFGYMSREMLNETKPSLNELFASGPVTVVHCRFMGRSSVPVVEPVPMTFSFYWSERYKKWVPCAMTVGFVEAKHFVYF